MLTTTALLATATALLYGVADFFGGLATRRDSAFVVTANAHLIGLAFFAVAVWFVPATSVGLADAGWGAFAGVSGGIGVVALYAALASGRMSVVAPITAALSGSLPALFDLVRGADIGSRSLAGLALALVAIVVVSASAGSDDEHGMPPRAVVLSVIAGCGFAGSFLGFSLASATSGIWPLLAARATSSAMLGSAALFRRGRLVLDPSARLPGLSAGVLDSVANVTMIAAIRSGPLAVASVLASLYPVATVLLARVVLGERMSPLQRVGAGAAFVAVIITALP